MTGYQSSQVGSTSSSDPSRSQDRLERAREAAETAVALDAGWPEAHLSLARVAGVLDWDFATAESSLLRAIELNPSLSRAHDRYARYLSLAGRHAEAQVANSKALELDPLSQEIHTNAARIAFYAERYDDARIHAQDALNFNTSALPARLLLAISAIQLGDYETGFDELKELERRPAIAGEIGHALAVSGSRDGALQVAEELRNLDRLPNYQLALVYAGLGEPNEALKWVERSVANRDPQSVPVHVDPRLKEVRQLPEFGLVGLEFPPTR